MYFPVSALLIEYIILTVVESRDSYGYEISQTVKKAADIKESTLYPILKKLQKAGYLTIRRSIREERENTTRLQRKEKRRLYI